MKLYLLLICSILSLNLLCQKRDPLSGPASHCNWSAMKYSPNYKPALNDTCLFVATIRNYNATLEEFVDYDFDTTGTIKYFAVYFNGNQWNAVPYSSLDSLLSIKENFKNMVILTEGLGKTFTSGIDRATRVLRNYQVDEIFFDWPTERPYMRAGQNIRVTARLAPRAAESFAKFLSDFQFYKNSNPEKFKMVTLLFHSMGNLLLMNSVKNNAFTNISPNVADAIILNAACVNQTNHKLWLDNLTISPRVYVTINDKDRNLRGARIIFGDHQLGEKPKSAHSEKAQYVNFSKVLGNEHNYYVMQPLLTQKPFIQHFYADIFNGKQPVTVFPADLTRMKKSEISQATP